MTTSLLLLLTFSSVFAYALSAGVLIEKIAQYWNRRRIAKAVVRRIMEVR